eukprot:2288866-Amphidinium_carterae.2
MRSEAWPYGWAKKLSALLGEQELGFSTSALCTKDMEESLYSRAEAARSFGRKLLQGVPAAQMNGEKLQEPRARRRDSMNSNAIDLAFGDFLTGEVAEKKIQNEVLAKALPNGTIEMTYTESLNHLSAITKSPLYTWCGMRSKAAVPCVETLVADLQRGSLISKTGADSSFIQSAERKLRGVAALEAGLKELQHSNEVVPTDFEELHLFSFALTLESRTLVQT